MTALDTSEFMNWYLGLSNTDKMSFLPLVLGHLTEHVRAFAGEQSETEKLRSLAGLDELSHQISFHFAGIGAKQIPDDVFVKTLLEKASSLGLLDHLTKSLQYARASHDRRSQK
jgi:hypothetical protein